MTDRASAGSVGHGSKALIAVNILNSQLMPKKRSISKLYGTMRKAKFNKNNTIQFKVSNNMEDPDRFSHLPKLMTSTITKAQTKSVN